MLGSDQTWIQALIPCPIPIASIVVRVMSSHLFFFSFLHNNNCKTKIHCKVFVALVWVPVAYTFTFQYFYLDFIPAAFGLGIFHNVNNFFTEFCISMDKLACQKCRYF